MLIILTNSLGDREKAGNLLRLLEWQSYSDGFIAGMNATEDQGEGRNEETP